VPIDGIWRFCILATAEGRFTADSIRAVLATQAVPPTNILVADVALSSFDELLNPTDMA
jgi:hypothetical protein